MKYGNVEKDLKDVIIQTVLNQMKGLNILI